MIATGLWLFALVGFAAAAAVANARGRARPDDVVARGVIAIAAVAYALIAVAAIWTWGGTRAREARAARLADGASVALELELAAPTSGAANTPPIAPATTTAPAVAPVAPVAPVGAKVERRIARAGDAMLVGPRVALPNVATWDVASLATHVAVAIPADPTACATWTPPAHPLADGRCELAVAPKATLRALPLVPDPDAVVDRATRATVVIAGPPLVALVALALMPRRHRRRRTFAGAIALASAAAGLVALVAWRLLWAYRIDVMRELATTGSRVATNQLGALAIGAALAGLAVAVLFAPPRAVEPEAAPPSAPDDAATPAAPMRPAHAFARIEARRAAALRAFAAFAAWGAWLAIATTISGALPATHRAPLLALSLATALLPLAPRASTAVRAHAPELALAAIAAAAIVLRTVAAHFVFGKLGLAFATVLAGHAALRDILARPTPLLRRAVLLAALVAASLALAHFDAGVALAIAGTGLALAMIVAGHDAAYDASHAAARVGLLEREHARLVVVHAAAAALLAIGLAATALTADARDLLAHGALAVTHAPLYVAALFAISALVARAHRRGWLPWLVAALACVALWAARDRLVERATAGDGTGAHRVAAVVEPGYALLADERAFAANAAAWRETTLEATTPDTPPDTMRGQGYFGARIRDPGVGHSVDNDYLAILVARDTGVGGLLATAALLCAIVAGTVAIAGARLGHASRAHRARLLVGALAGVLVLYQPLASLGVLPLTGISWPGLGIDSPTDLWIFVLGIAWLALPPLAPPAAHDERIRRTPRVARARRLALLAVGLAAGATIAIVGRAGACALDRVPLDDARIDAALRYAGSLACPWRETTAPSIAELVPPASAFVSHPDDPATTRFDGELRARYAAARPALVDALAAKRAAVFTAGWPAVHFTVDGAAPAFHATCTIEHTDDAIAALRSHAHLASQPRIRVIARPLGVAAHDLGEVDFGDHLVRLRPDATTATGPLSSAASIAIGDAKIEARDAAARITGKAQLFAEAHGTWQPLETTTLDRTTLVVSAGTAAVYTPGAELALADDGDPHATTARRVYPLGAALPELGWVDPYDVDRSLGLDGWIHAALAHPGTTPSCGTLAPPAPSTPCRTSPRDGTLECAVALQPELALALARLADDTLATTHATRAAVVLLRGDTGELLAQHVTSPERPPLAYTPNSPAAERALITLLDTPGESAGERVDWNAAIAAGSTMKPIIARAAEDAAPALLAHLTLNASGHAPRCPGRRGKSVDPIFGHCPPTSVAAPLTTADVHDFLAYSPNWFEAALGIAGLGLAPDAHLALATKPITLAQLLARDVASIPTTTPLTIADATGPILTRNKVFTDGIRRTPFWQRVEQITGHPTCTHCALAAARADTCAARALPLASPPSANLRYLLALGPDRIELPDGPVSEYFQLLRGSGARPLGSLPQIADAFNRIVYDPTPSPAPLRLAASWFPAPVVGTLPAYTCADPSTGHDAAVRGTDGGLCAVVRQGGTAFAGIKPLLADPRIHLLGAKTGTIDSLADLARKPAACKQWNATHPAASQLACGKPTPDDSLLVLAFSITTPTETIPFTLAIQLQRGGKGAAAHAAPALVTAVADYFAPRPKS